jgi:hypothetical protein
VSAVVFAVWVAMLVAAVRIAVDDLLSSNAMSLMPLEYYALLQENATPRQAFHCPRARWRTTAIFHNFVNTLVNTTFPYVELLDYHFAKAVLFVAATFYHMLLRSSEASFVN